MTLLNVPAKTVTWELPIVAQICPGQFSNGTKIHGIGALYADKKTTRRTKVKKGTEKCIFQWTSVFGGWENVFEDVNVKDLDSKRKGGIKGIEGRLVS
jgi:hypothetical protein